MTRLGDEWHATDPDPPPGTILEKGNPDDRVSFLIGDHNWMYAYNPQTTGHYRPCHRRLAEHWAPLKVVRAFSGDKKQRT